MFLAHFMFLNYSSNYRHPPVSSLFQAFPFPTHRLSAVQISRLSIGTMGMLRLPSSFSFSFPSVSLGTDTTYACCLFLPLLQGQQVPWVTRSIGHAANRICRVCSCGDVRLSRVPVLPFSASDMFSDPDQTATSRLCRCFGDASTIWTVKTPVLILLPRLHSIPSTISVYASCQRLRWLRKTRFRWVAGPFRTGLVTCRETKRCFITFNICSP